jgi:hypothetical protein
MKVYLAPIQAIVSNLCATVLQKPGAGKLVVDGLWIWHALHIFRRHKIEYATELTSAKWLSKSCHSHVSLCLNNIGLHWNGFYYAKEWTKKILNLILIIASTIPAHEKPYGCWRCLGFKPNCLYVDIVSLSLMVLGMFSCYRGGI